MKPPGARVVVTGLGALSPLGPDVPRLADALRAGRPAIAATGPGEPVPYRAALPDAAVGEALTAAALPPAATRRTSRPARAALAVAGQAWRAAGLHLRAPDPRRIAVVVAGNNLNGAQSAAAAARLAKDPMLVPPRLALQHQDTDQVATLSEAFGIRGEGLTVGGASASGNLALIHGARLVSWGVAEVCLVVGALAEPAPAELRSYLNLGAMVPTAGSGPGGPFDRSHRGFVHGPAAAAMVLESAESAAHRGAAARAELAGWAAGLDANSQPDPTVEGEAEVMARALADAGISAAEVDLIGAHGTGSPLGDRVEADAIARVFGAVGPWVNTVKGLAGHALTAAGTLSAVAVVLQLGGGFVHPTPWVRDPIDGAPRLVGDAAVTTPLRWALSNAFGFGGFNSSLVWRAAP
ncbi:beta-ketoacyl synthase N-terminal-like domain-containing protein [Streptomyces goshikiensis]|uniref:beta-ketoacyl synthase N-terminal-like domain-containing protein n=1 Tax=Streptomyces TaxID=1883 RepID=UPI000CA2BD03|nr:beta-ketoacyl synthase N-terminal-like domain-containing protein [Streptomyces sp. CB02120-2]ATY69586.1 beta-ketoacyl-ACP synthase [Streptomyces sp. CB02120-2]